MFLSPPFIFWPLDVFCTLVSGSFISLSLAPGRCVCSSLAKCPLWIHLACQSLPPPPPPPPPRTTVRPELCAVLSTCHWQHACKMFWVIPGHRHQFLRWPSRYIVGTKWAWMVQKGFLLTHPLVHLTITDHIQSSIGSIEPVVLKLGCGPLQWGWTRGWLDKRRGRWTWRLWFFFLHQA